MDENSSFESFEDYVTSLIENEDNDVIYDRETDKDEANDWIGLSEPLSRPESKTSSEYSIPDSAPERKAKMQTWKEEVLVYNGRAVVSEETVDRWLKDYAEMNDPNKDGTAKRAYQLQNIEKYQTPHGGSQKTVSLRSASSGTLFTVADLFAAVKAKDSGFKPVPSKKRLQIRKLRFMACFQRFLRILQISWKATQKLIIMLCGKELSLNV